MKNNLLKEITQIVFFTAVVFFSAYYFVPGVAEAINNIDEGYRLVPTQTVTLAVHGVQCKEITANGSKDVFLPSRSSEEYTAFLAHKPSDVTVIDCTVPDTCETETVSWGGKTYSGVRIGNQCWMNKNLNYGTLLGSTQYPTNNGISEKACPGNVESGCTNGALYTLSEAMNYSTTEGAQGICPPGWHIPTRSEHDLLVETEVGALPTTFGAVKNALGPGTTFDNIIVGYGVWAGYTPNQYWNYAGAGTDSKLVLSSQCTDCAPNFPNYALEVTTNYQSASYVNPTLSNDANPVRCIKGAYTAPPPMN
ncbi:MAG: FISUMP domain-containing protein [Bacillota bacterium]